MHNNEGLLGYPPTTPPPTTRRFLNPQMWSAIVGFPVTGMYQPSGEPDRLGVWFLDAASHEAIETHVFPDAGWTSMDLWVWFLNTQGGAAGNVVMRGSYRSLTPGKLVTSAVTPLVDGKDTTFAVDAQHTLKAVKLLQNIPVRENQALVLQIRRAGTDAADTYGSDYSIFGAELRTSGAK